MFASSPIGYKGAPLKFYCSEHSLNSGKPNVWLLVGDVQICEVCVPLKLNLIANQFKIAVEYL